MKLFKVAVEFDYVVVAKDSDSARDVASKYVHEAFSDSFDSSCLDVSDYTPGSIHEWTGDIEPYGGNKTIDEYLKETQ